MYGRRDGNVTILYRHYVREFCRATCHSRYFETDLFSTLDRERPHSSRNSNVAPSGIFVPRRSSLLFRSRCNCKIRLHELRNRHGVLLILSMNKDISRYLNYILYQLFTFHADNFIQLKFEHRNFIYFVARAFIFNTKLVWGFIYNYR